MFTWIPIHEEAAKRLLEYRDRSHELVEILARMHEAGLKATSINDQGEDGSVFSLKEIDPFTFLANFNRGVTHENRRALWKVLKDEWHLRSELPQDFDGIPVANLQASWLMPYAKKRSVEHVPLLWQFYEHIMSATPETLDAALMQKCLDLHRVGFTMLSMGMFWACPRKWISADAKNVGFSKTKGVAEPAKTGIGYANWIPSVLNAAGGDIVEFSREAHVWATSDNTTGGYGPPFDKLFPSREPHQLLDYFARVIAILREESENPDELLSMTLRKRSGGVIQMRITIGMWAVTAIAAKPGRRMVEFLVPFDHPEAIRYREESKTEGRELGNGYAELLDGVRYDLAYLPEAEFFARFDELWPVIENSLKAASRHFSGKRFPFRGNHRQELEDLCMEVDRRESILAKGLSFRTATADRANGNRRYWLIAPGEGAKWWDLWTEENIAAIGWGKIGDLNAYQSKSEIQAALQAIFPEGNQAAVASMLWNFSHVMAEGDVVFAKLGRSEVIGWGVVRGGVSYDAGQEELPNLRPVEWEEQKAVKLPDGRMLAMKSLTPITEVELLGILAGAYSGVPGLEKREEESEVVAPATVSVPAYRIEDALTELFMSRDALTHILEQLRRKKNIILQGAPGVGKTFIAKRLAWLHLEERDDSAVEMVQFHQSYTYEDFVQGLRPTKDGHFAVKDGCFYRLCRKALANPQQDFFLVIDEINRGNLSKILGELMMLIETDKRGQEMTLAYSEESFTVPPNVYLIGTMNTADRSLSLVDYALRRRFAFLTLDPGFETEAFAAHLGGRGVMPDQIKMIRSQMAALNLEISKDEANLGSGYRIGHSFFTPTGPVTDFHKWFQSIVRYEILPLLEEYWVDDPKRVQQFHLALTEGAL